MVRVLSLLAAPLGACQVTALESDRPEESRHDAEPPAAGDLVEIPVPVGDPTEDDDHCVDLDLTTDVSFGSTVTIRTQEDFDFDVLGFLDTERGYDIAGYTRSGDHHFVARSVAPDTAGMRSLATGDLVVAAPYSGMVKRVSYETGETTTIIGGLVSPKGVEAGLDGLIYVSEYFQNGSVRMIDPYTGENEVVVELAYPNGLALSNDDQTLYIATSGGWKGGIGAIAAIDRDADGRWIPEPRLVYQSQSLVDAMAADDCGNLYVAESWTGRVFRIRGADGEIDALAELDPGPWGLTAARFGPGIGDFFRDQLFVTNRTQVFVLEIGIDGRHVLAP